MYGKTGTFTVTDNNEYLYEREVMIPGDGIMGVEYSEVNLLESDKVYEWSFRVTCGEEPDVNDPSVISYLNKVDREVSQATAMSDKIVEDAQNGLWYNSLTNALKQENQTSLNQLLKSIEAETPNESVYLVNIDN